MGMVLASFHLSLVIFLSDGRVASKEREFFSRPRSLGHPSNILYTFKLIFLHLKYVTKGCNVVESKKKKEAFSVREDCDF